jgi:hypothetical protein
LNQADIITPLFIPFFPDSIKASFTLKAGIANTAISGTTGKSVIDENIWIPSYSQPLGFTQNFCPLKSLKLFKSSFPIFPFIREDHIITTEDISKKLLMLQ